MKTAIPTVIQKGKKNEGGKAPGGKRKPIGGPGQERIAAKTVPQMETGKKSGREERITVTSPADEFDRQKGPCPERRNLKKKRNYLKTTIDRKAVFTESGGGKREPAGGSPQTGKRGIAKAARAESEKKKSGGKKRNDPGTPLGSPEKKKRKKEIQVRKAGWFCWGLFRVHRKNKLKGREAKLFL